MRKFINNFVSLALLGTIWGFVEVVLGGALYDAKIESASVYLGILAIGLLALGRNMVKLPGSSLAIGLIAAVFKLVNAAPFYCHLLGIITVAGSFELVSLFFLQRSTLIRQIFGGAAIGYLSSILFVVIIAYAFRSEYWQNWAKIQNQIFVNGSLTALGACFIVPFGSLINEKLESTAKLINPRWVEVFSLAAVAILWIIPKI